jgi:hypothetical protein
VRTLFTLLAVLSLTASAAAQGQEPLADAYRGGWRTNAGDPHIYQFAIRGDRVRGVYCTRCSDATTLAFIDGTFGPSGITFTVTHVKADGSTDYLDRATARFDNGTLIVAGTSSGGRGGGKFTHTVHKDPRGPDGLPTAVNRLPPGPPVPPIAPGAPGGGGGGGGGRGPAAYLQPGPWRQLSQSDIVGVWLGFGVGINKQYFIVRRVGSGLRGMVCGRCDNPYTMAALDDFVIKGDTMTFNILHEDWGPGSLPFMNQVTARIAQNEMRITTVQDNLPPPPPPPAGRIGGSSLIGPIAIEATRGND